VWCDGMNVWKGLLGLRGGDGKDRDVKKGRRGKRRRRREGSLCEAPDDVFQLCYVPLPTCRTVYRSGELVKTL